MDAPAPQPIEQTRQRVSLKKPLVISSLPFILLFPTLWVFTSYIPEHSGAVKKLGEDHIRAHYGIFWMLAFSFFSSVCFFISTVMFVRRARYSTAARIALVPAVLLALLMMLVLVMILSGA